MTDARTPRFLQRATFLALFLAFTLAAIGPIRNYDYFWHLATGRWIAGHHALPQSDPFAVGSEKHDWINGEWLFQVAAYGVHEAVGLRGSSVVRALLAATIFALAWLLGRRDLFVTAVAFAGAMQTFDWRPSSVAMLLVVLALAARTWAGHGLVTLFWINVHPSALLAPGIALLTTRRVAPVIASALALLVNPHGWRAITAPLELMTFVGSGAFVNAEWLPSRVTQFPLLYLCVLGGAVVLIKGCRLSVAGDRQSEDDAGRLSTDNRQPTTDNSSCQWWRVLLFAGFAYLAIRHVRNQGLFFAAFPLLMPRIELRRALELAGAAAAIVLIALTADHRLGVAPERFPVAAVARLQASGLRGNIYNPDQFGGFLIWSFYPERRVLTDGRNELYRRYIAEYARARGDQRAWRALLRKYRIDVAVDEHRPPLQVIDAVTGERREMPAWLAYWPRSEWALLARDEAGMVFARRAAFEAGWIGKWELPAN